MDDTSTPVTPSGSTPSNPSLQEQLDGMRNIVTILLATVICIGGSVSVYLYRQATLLSRQVSEGKRIAIDFETNSLPRIRNFVGNLQTFSKSNPDFGAILAKYPLQPVSTPVAAPAAATPVAPAKPATPPKK